MHSLSLPRWLKTWDVVLLFLTAQNRMVKHTYSVLHHHRFRVDFSIVCSLGAVRIRANKTEQMSHKKPLIHFCAIDEKENSCFMLFSPMLGACATCTCCWQKFLKYPKLFCLVRSLEGERILQRSESRKTGWWWRAWEKSERRLVGISLVSLLCLMWLHRGPVQGNHFY